MNVTKGMSCVIADGAKLGENVVLRHNCIIEDNTDIGDNTYIDSNTIIRNNTTIEKNSFIGANCIIGEYWMDFCKERNPREHLLTIGKNALIRRTLFFMQALISGVISKLAIRSQSGRRRKSGTMLALGRFPIFRRTAILGIMSGSIAIFILETFGN